jgi:hypothetical protein
VVINLEHDNVAAYKQLKAMAIDAKVPDPTCARLYNKVECWRNREMCAGYYNDENVDERTRLLVDTYYAWPSSGSLTDWWSYADRARLSIPTPGASELALSALENAVQAGDGCPLGLALSIHHTIEEIRHDLAATGLANRLVRLKQACPTQSAPALPAASANPGAASP